MSDIQKIGQFIYTASPWGRSDPGWMVFATSAEMDVSLAESLKRYYRYITPDGMSTDPSPDELSSYPIQYVVAKVRDGEFVIVSQTTFTGRRWYDPRPGDWIAHVFLVPITSYKMVIGDGKHNPFAWFRSGTFKEKYQEEWKNTAEAISRKDIPYEAPPTLDTLEAITEIDVNGDYEFTSLLYDIDDAAFPKIGSVLGTIWSRQSGTGRAFVFDATNPMSAKTMALLLELLPGTIRVDAEFATYLHSEVAAEIQTDSRFLFYGTVREGVTSDFDTGLYGEFPQNDLNFRGREDVDLFKQMLDSVSPILKEDEFNSFIKCWNVAAGFDISVDGMREANNFCAAGNVPRFPELHTLLLEKIAAQLSEDVNADDVEWRNRFAAARYEIGAELDEYASDQFFEACVMDRAAFDSACQCVRTDPHALRLFLKELESASSSKEFKENLAERLLETNMITKGDVIAVKDKLPFINLIFKYREIVKRGSDQVNASADDIKVVEDLQCKFGINISGMDDVLEMLKYKCALLEITSIEDIAKCLKPPFSQNVALLVTSDLASRIKPSSPHDKVELARALDKIGMSGNDYIEMEWIKELARSNEELRHVNEELKKVKERNAELTKRPRLFSVVCIGILCVLIGWAGHSLFGGSRRRANQTVDIEVSGEATFSHDRPQTNATPPTPDLPVLEQTEEVHALASKEGTQLVAGEVAANTTERERDNVVQKPQAVLKKRSDAHLSPKAEDLNAPKKTKTQFNPGTEIKTDKKSSSAPKDAGVK